MAILVLLQLSLAAVLAAVIATYVYRRYFHPLSRFPGPFLASITNLWRFYVYFTGEHHHVEKDLHDRYGPVIRTGPDSLSFGSLPTFEAVYGYNKHIEKGDSYNFGRDPNNHLGSVFTAATDAEHKECRRKVAPAFTSTKIAAYQPVVSNNASLLQERISVEVEKNPILNIVHEVKRYTFDTAITAIFGDSLSTEPWTSTPAGQNVIENFSTMLKLSGGIPLLPWLANITYMKSVKTILRKPRFDKNGTMIGAGAVATAARKAIFNDPDKVLKSNEPSILKSFMNVPEDDSRKMRQDELMRECINMVFAGQSSTSAAIIATLYELAQPHGQDWQRRIRNELSTDLEINQNPASSSIITAILKETMRLRAPFSTAFPRVVTHGAENAIPDLPVPIPVGTTISSNTYILGHAKKLWGEDVEEWKPERWLDVGHDEKAKRRLEDHFVVFGKGPRGCVGKDLAIIMLAEAVAKVVERWNLVAKSELKGKNFLEMQYELCEIEFEAVGEK